MSTNRRLSLTIPLVIALLGSACSKPKPSTTEARPTTPATVSSVKPGSHEDWCDEHQVPESMCTKCNPDLVPAFKAAGDWCEEHATPESQCKKCKPSLKIVRPPKS